MKTKKRKAWTPLAWIFVTLVCIISTRAYVHFPDRYYSGVSSAAIDSQKVRLVLRLAKKRANEWRIKHSKIRPSALDIHPDPAFSEFEITITGSRAGWLFVANISGVDTYSCERLVSSFLVDGEDMLNHSGDPWYKTLSTNTGTLIMPRPLTPTEKENPDSFNIPWPPMSLCSSSPTTMTWSE